MAKSALDWLRLGPLLARKMIRTDGSLVNEADTFDKYVNAQSSQDAVHTHAHEGILFDLSRKISILSATDIYLVGVTQANIIHFNKINYDSNGGGIEIRLLEDVVFSGGSLAIGINRNRISLNTSSLLIYEGSTVTNDGTQLSLKGMPTAVSGGTPAQVPLSADDTEWVLSPGKNYAIKISNVSTGDRILYIDMLFYEPGLLP